jgi:hypothetical protein
MGFETYEEMEAWADSLEQSDLEAHDAAVYRTATGQATPTEPVSRPHATENTQWLISLLRQVSGPREMRNQPLMESVLLELELRGVPVWRCDGCDLWLEDTERAHVIHSVECRVNGR